MTKKYPVDSINIENPCSEPWENMQGSREKRFCKSCEKDVFNLSAMSRRRANLLLRRSDGKICVRFARSSDGKMINKGRSLYQIARRTGPIAAGIIAATLSASAVSYAQGGVRFTEPRSSKTEIEELLPERLVSAPVEGDVSQISFSVTDQNGEPMGGARVVLIEKESGRYFMTTTDSTGLAEFNLLPKSLFNLEITYPGFTARRGRLRISQLVEPSIVINLQAENAGRSFSTDNFDFEVPLFGAIAKGDKEAYKAAIAAGFDLETKGGDSETALHVAVENHQTELVELILIDKADVEAKDDYDRTPIVVLAEDVGEGNEDVARILRLLIAHEADINKADDSGETILMEAAYYDDAEVVEILLEAGADTGLKNEDGQTAYQRVEDDDVRAIFHRYGIFR